MIVPENNLQRQIVLIWERIFLVCKEKPRGLCLSCSVHYAFISFAAKYKVFSLAQVRYGKCEEKPNKVNTSLFSIHAYLYRLQRDKSLFFSKPFEAGLKPRKGSVASSAGVGGWGGGVDWLAPGRLCANALFHYSLTLSKAPLFQARLFLLRRVSCSLTNTNGAISSQSGDTHVDWFDFAFFLFCTDSEMRQTLTQREKARLMREMGRSRGTKEGNERINRSWRKL